MKIYNSLCILVILVFSCSSTQKLKGEPSETLKTLVAEKTFTISSDWADPQFTQSFSQLSAIAFTPGNSVGGLIDISGFNNYLTFRNDSVFGYFPYYGERQMTSSYTNIDQGIQFEGVPEDLEIVEKGSSYKIKFNIKDAKARNEKYEIRVQLNSKFKTYIDINSTHRNSIRYEGDIALNN